MRRRASVLVLAAMALVLGPLAPSASAEVRSEKYPVPYSFVVPAVLAGLQVDADPPGSNIWTCKPTAAHPDPVILVHGLTGNKNTNWHTFSPLLANEGYCVYALTYGVADTAPLPLNQFGGLNSMPTSADELSDFVDKVLASTGASKVNLLGHSEGTLISGYYAKFLGTKKVAKVASLAPLWHGTNTGGLATLITYGAAFGFAPIVKGVFAPFFASGPELLTGSAFIGKLRSGGTIAAPGVKYTNIVTRFDELVQPYTSGIEPGTTNHVVQDLCPLDLGEHFAIAADPTAADLVLNAFDPAHPRPVRCQLVLPVL